MIFQDNAGDVRCRRFATVPPAGPVPTTVDMVWVTLDALFAWTQDCVVQQRQIPVSEMVEGDNSVSDRTASGVDSGIRQRRQAVRELGAALRELNEAAASTEVDVDALLLAAERARELVPVLAARSRGTHQLPSVDGDLVRMYNPAEGPGNPLAPPMRVKIVDGLAVGSCALGLIYEGPPGYVHGGISALLVDQILGHVHAAHGWSGMTVSLSIRYRAPVPLRTPLVISGRVVESERRRRMTSKATIAVAANPDTVLVEGEGTFVVPRPDQVRALFGEAWSEIVSRR